MTIKSDNSKWKPRFLELVLRAVKAVHHRYVLWDIGSVDLSGSGSFKKLSAGSGIELADELTVCDAITQEIQVSNILLGHSQSDGRRDYNIKREFLYYNCQERSDMMIQRKNKIREWEEVYIEAKRVNYFRTDFHDNKFKRKNVAEIRQDVEKLTMEWEYLAVQLQREDITHRYRACILIWGLYEENSSRFVLVDDLINMVNKYSNPSKKLKPLPNGFLTRHPLIKWYPLRWDEFTGSPNKPTRWVWISLLELDFEKY